MKIVVSIIFAFIATLPFQLRSQSTLIENNKVKNFVKGIPTDLDKQVLVLSKEKFDEVLLYGPEMEEKDKHWAKCIAAMEKYPFKYVILNFSNESSEADSAKYIIKFYPEKLSAFEKGNLGMVPTDFILTLEEKGTNKHYGLKEQMVYGNSRANYSYLEIKQFIKEVRKQYKIEDK